jgi:hypothetical protein
MRSAVLLGTFLGGIVTGAILTERRLPAPQTRQPAILRLDDGGGADLVRPPCLPPLRCDHESPLSR